MNAKDGLLLGVVGVGFYMVYKTIKEAANVKEKLVSMGEAIGSGLFDYWNPDPVGETLFYMVTFPNAPIADGQRHSVPSRSVNAQGVFTLSQFFGNTRWRMLIDKDGKKYAVKV